MQLLKIYSNKKSFKTVIFNASGLNFIIAKQKNPDSTTKGQTYNGVGKSLLIKIIHFCLGSSKESCKSFCKELPGWEFYIDFLIEEKIFICKRATDNADRIFMNNEELTIRKFNLKMQSLCFEIDEKIKFLSFRSLIPFFIRPNKESYVSYDKPSKVGSEYQSVLYNTFLLGLDVFLAQKKYNLKKEKEKIKIFENNFKNDSLIRNFFTKNKDINLTIIELDEKIKKLDENLDNFRVASDYYEVQVNADKVEKELFNLNNEIVLLQNNINDIDEGLKISPTMNKKDVVAVYEELEIFFSKTLTKTLDNLEEFYEKLITNRKKRLLEQKNKLVNEKNLKLEKSNNLQKDFDELLKYLGDHQALDIFVNLTNKSSKLKSERDKLIDYQNVQQQYKNKERKIEKEEIFLTEETDLYLEKMKNDIKEQTNYFRKLAKKFYPNSVAGLTIDNNDGNNQIRYNIEAKIESDESDGINNVKIFCYDLTILFKGYNHKIKCIFHDSRIFHGIDERQKAEMFRIVKEKFENNNRQYITTINQNQLSELKTQLSNEEYEKIVNKNTILVLTDDSDESKLLGIKVDIS
jgi:uncharacterized protein YydD (DUF2326 family)